eukprot:3582289-Ditylum_brightwellii.AAC.2
MVIGGEGCVGRDESDGLTKEVCEHLRGDNSISMANYIIIRPYLESSCQACLFQTTVCQSTQEETLSVLRWNAKTPILPRHFCFSFTVLCIAVKR